MKVLLSCLLILMAMASKSKMKLRMKAKAKAKSKQFMSEVINYQGKSQYDPSTNKLCQVTGGDECPCNCPSCPPCILSKTQRKMHERAQKDARADQNTQAILVKESDLQEKLFGAAQKYAGEVAKYEEEAKELALKMQKVASMAEVSRTKMIKAENQAKQLAMKTINTMTVYPPHIATRTPELTVTNAGYTQTMIKQYEPQYSIKIGDTDSNGYIDPITSSVYSDASRTISTPQQQQQQQKELGLNGGAAAGPFGRFNQKMPVQQSLPQQPQAFQAYYPSVPQMQTNTMPQMQTNPVPQTQTSPMPYQPMMKQMPDQYQVQTMSPPQQMPPAYNFSPVSIQHSK